MAFAGVFTSMVRMLSNLVYKQPKMHQVGSVCCNWDVLPILNSLKRGLKTYAVIVLNRPITQSQKFVMKFWNEAVVRVTVDGGTRRWDSFLKQLPDCEKNKLKLPELITGDFDSIPEEIFEKYKKKGCEMVETPDQNYTDFTKALLELNKYCETHKLSAEHVIAMGQSSGRIDQVLGNIQTLFLVKEKQLLNPIMKVYLMSDDSMSWLLYPGTHIISIPEETRKHRRAWCSLVPIGETCVSVTTSGLKWNLSKQSLKFGDLVSTSNSFDGSQTVTVICSHTILWSMKIPFLIDQ